MRNSNSLDKTSGNGSVAQSRSKIRPSNGALKLSQSRRNAHSKAAGEKAAGASDRIIEAATKLFAEQGYDCTSTKDICQRAKVNIAAIHYHFGSKDELYRVILKRFGGDRVGAVQRILIGPNSIDELKVRLQLFLSESLQVCLQQPDLCRIVQREIELLHPRSEEVFRETFIKLSENLVSFLYHAKKSGLLDKNVDAKIAGHFLFNQLRQATRADAVNHKYFRFSIRDKKFRKIWIEQTLRVFIGGIIARA